VSRKETGVLALLARGGRGTFEEGELSEFKPTNHKFRGKHATFEMATRKDHRGVH